MIKKANIQWSAKQLTKSIQKGTVRFDSSVQRGLVWDQPRKSLLIHSMMEGYPIPAFFAAKDEKIYQFLDGKQRSDAISKYINNEYELTGIPEVILEFEETIDVNGLTFEQLPEELQDNIKDYSLTVYYFDGITDEEINELFYRLNNGKPLTAIELTRVKAKSLETIQDIGKHEIFTNALTEKALNKYTNEDLVIKSWAILNTENPSFETKHIRPVMESADITEEQANTITAVYDRLLEVHTSLSNTEDKQDKKVAKRIITRTHMVSLVPIIAKLINSESWDTEQFTNWIRHFFSGKRSATNNDLYNNAARSGSGKSENVKRRLEVINDDFKEFVLTSRVNNKKQVEQKQQPEPNNNDAFNTIVETIEEVERESEQAESQDNQEQITIEGEAC